MVSGSWPGEIFFFAGSADGAFEESVTLQDESGEAINVGSASAVALHDWDNDGDLDLLVGVIEGDVKFLPNLGGSGLPKFGKAQVVKVAGDPVKMSGDAGPVVADWDGDGMDDLICGDGNGAVMLFRATGRNNKNLPVLAAGVELIPAVSSADRTAAHENPVNDPEGKLAKRSGDRTKVCVTDWNGDGRLDLLVGDFASSAAAAPELTDEDIAERDQLREQQAQAMEKYTALWEVLDARLRERVGVEPGAALTPAQQEQWGELWEEVSKEVEGFTEVWEEIQALWPKLSRFEPQMNYHGWVWVYLRTPEVKAAAESVEQQAKRIDLKEPTARQPFTAGAALFPANEPNVVTLIVRGRLASGWHLYANVPSDEPYIQTALSLQLPEGAEAIGEWTTPRSIVDPHAPKLRLWMGDLVFARQIRLSEATAASDVSIGCTISFQCCDENQCLPPDTIELTTPLNRMLVRR